MSPTRKKAIKRILIVLVVIFAGMNGIAAMHAYKFTHYSAGGEKSRDKDLNLAQKVGLLVAGIDNPRPQNTVTPPHPYSTIHIASNTDVECWHIPALSTRHKGMVIMFHGYTSNKGALLDRAEPLLHDGYDCLLVDFMGSGGSGGNVTTVGYKEAQEVTDCYNYIKQRGEQHIYLYGSSMGAAAIMKALADSPLQPAAAIVECPFAGMYQTIAIRFRAMGVPTFPMAGLLLFWGGAENGFPAWRHNPADYAARIHCPVMLQYGAQDDRVDRAETNEIYANLHTEKELVIYPNAGHDNYLKKCGPDWTRNMLRFLNTH